MNAPEKYVDILERNMAEPAAKGDQELARTHSIWDTPEDVRKKRVTDNSGKEESTTV